MNATKFTDGFSEKIHFWGKHVVLGRKMVYPHNFGSAQRFFFFYNERCHEVRGNYINGFSEKKSHVRQMDHFCLKITHPNSGSTLRIYFEILPNERWERHTKIILFFQKKYNFGNWTILA